MLVGRLIRTLSLSAVFAAAIFVSVGLLSGAATAQTNFDKMQSSGKFTVGLINQPPFAKFDPNTQAWSGPSYEIAKLIAEAAGLQLTIVESTYQTVIPSLQAGKIDATLSPFYATPKRAQAIWFTIPYRYERSGILIRKADVAKFKTPEDLNKSGVLLVANLGSASEADGRRFFPNTTVKGVPSDSIQLEVQAGRADAWIADMTTVALAAERNKDWAAVWNPDYVFNAVPMAFMIKRGEQDLLYFLNTSLDYYLAQGVIAAIDKKGGLPEFKRPNM